MKKVVMCCGRTGETIGSSMPNPSLAEATAALRAALEKLKASVVKLPAVESVEREVVAVYLTPAAPGKQAELVKIVRIGPAKDERVFALPTPYHEHIDALRADIRAGRRNANGSPVA